MAAFNLIALDKNHKIISILRPVNVQWNRMYHEAGTFSIQLPLNQYSSNIRYVYTKDRPEIGRVSQINYSNQAGFQYIQISGYFEEKDLDRHVVYPPGASNIITSPTWVEQSGAAEDVAYTFFEWFKGIATSLSNYSVLQIDAEESLGRGKQSCHHRNGEALGYKLYDILKPSGMSYRVKYDFEADKRTLQVWEGKNRTQENPDGNNPVIFSTKYGNIKNPNVYISENMYKNACIITSEQTKDDVKTYTSRFVTGDVEDEYRIVYATSTLNPNDFDEEGFQAALESEAQNKLSECTKTVNVEFESSAGSYEYLVDFDLGDMCSLDIPEMDFSADARIIGIYEVMKSGEWSMIIEFGTPIIKKK